MAHFRLIPSVIVTVLCLSIPSIANAQRVHEVRPSGADEVLIGTEDNASIDEVVALAQRISGNTELTAEDVIANNDHVRYACRADGRLVYFGSDPAYGGDRCPEDAIRRRGVLRDSTYRVPRRHGEVLTRRATRVTHRESPTAPVAEPEIVPEVVPETVPVTPPEPEIIERTEYVRVPVRETVTVTEHARPWELFLAVLFTVGVMLAIYGMFVRQRTLRPFEEQIKRLRAELGQRIRALNDADRALKEDEKVIKRLKKSRQRLYAYVGELRAVREELRQKADEADEYAARRERLADRHRRILELREQDELHDRYLRQIAEAQTYLSLQTGETPDHDLVKLCTATIETCKQELSRIPFDLVEIRKNLRDESALQCMELEEQCGYLFSGDTSDDWKAEWEAHVRTQLAKAEAKRQVFEDMLHKQREEVSGVRAALALGNEQELAQAKRKLEEQYAAKDGALMGKLWHHGLDASTAREDAKQYEKAAVHVRKQLEESQQRLGEALKELKQSRLRETALMKGEESDQATATLILGYDMEIARLHQALNNLTGGRWSDTPAAPVAPPASEEPPPNDDSSPSIRPMRPQRVTDLIGPGSNTGRVSIPGAPPLRRETPFLAELFEYLEHFTQGNNGSVVPDKLIRCSELEGRDLLYFLHNFSIECAALLPKPVTLRKFAITVEKTAPDLLRERFRRKTDPPGAPVPV